MRVPMTAKSCWIDMETGVRSGADAFDLVKVREVLVRTKPFVRSA
jgi:hypothetical protein